VAAKTAASGEDRTSWGHQGVINVQMRLPGDDGVMIIIQDNGEGMTKKTIEAIFDPFFTTKSEGTGLGLSIVHRILEFYQAPLNVHSRLGQGSRFSIRFKKSQPPH
jgi:two-component system sensor histidine kinase PilS (NtrC family)